MLPRTMPLPKRPYVASADEVRITRDGDYAIIEYADPKVTTTNLTVGAEKLATAAQKPGLVGAAPGSASAPRSGGARSGVSADVRPNR